MRMKPPPRQLREYDLVTVWFKPSSVGAAKRLGKGRLAETLAAEAAGLLGITEHAEIVTVKTRPGASPLEAVLAVESPRLSTEVYVLAAARVPEIVLVGWTTRDSFLWERGLAYRHARDLRPLRVLPAPYFQPSLELSRRCTRLPRRISG